MKIHLTIPKNNLGEQTQKKADFIGNYDLTNSKSLTVFQNNIKKYISELQQNKKTITLTQRGKNTAVVLDAKKYQEMQDELEFMRKTSNGLEDLKCNRVHDSVEVFNEIEEILKETKSVEDNIPESNSFFQLWHYSSLFIFSLK